MCFWGVWADASSCFGRRSALSTSPQRRPTSDGSRRVTGGDPRRGRRRLASIKQLSRPCSTAWATSPCTMTCRDRVDIEAQSELQLAKVLKGPKNTWKTYGSAPEIVPNTYLRPLGSLVSWFLSVRQRQMAELVERVLLDMCLLWGGNCATVFFDSILCSSSASLRTQKKLMDKDLYVLAAQLPSPASLGEGVDGMRGLGEHTKEPHMQMPDICGLHGVSQPP